MGGLRVRTEKNPRRKIGIPAEVTWEKEGRKEGKKGGFIPRIQYTFWLGLAGKQTSKEGSEREERHDKGAENTHEGPRKECAGMDAGS